MAGEGQANWKTFNVLHCKQCHTVHLLLNLCQGFVQAPPQMKDSGAEVFN